MGFLVILALAIALVAVLFALQNTGFATINFFGWILEERLALVLLGTLAVGVIVGLLISIPSLVRRNMRISKHRRELENLGWEFQKKDEEITAQQHEVQEIQHKHHDLLAALGLTDARTGLLDEQFVMPALSYLLQQSTTKVRNPRYRSVSTFLVEAYPDPPDMLLDQAVQDRLLRSIALRLQRMGPADHWLFHNGKGGFICIAPGLDTQSASNYTEALRTKLTETPLDFENGTPVPVTVSVGGAIAFPPEHVDANALLQQAYDALEHAKRRGRNRIRLVEAKAQRV